MSSCKQCGSHAINPGRHGRDNTDLDLCDVCYWRVRADTAYKAGMERDCEAQHGDLVRCNRQLHERIAELEAEVERLTTKNLEWLDSWCRDHDRMLALEEAAREARDALQYHTSKTRPIFNTTEAIAKLDAVLGNA